MFGDVSTEKLTDESHPQLTKWASITTGAMLVSSFIFLIGLSIYQLGFWQYYFFDDSSVVSEECRYSAVEAPTKTPPEIDVNNMKAIKLPHLGVPLFSTSTANEKYRHVIYKCQIPVVKSATGITNLHMGWVFADYASIRLNETLRHEFKGSDKPIIPLLDDDLNRGSLDLVIYLRAESDKRIGVNGAMPMALTAGVTANSKIMGIETALQNIRPLFRLLPTMTMGLILIMGWFLGIKTGLLVATQFYFVMVIATNLMRYATDFFGWNIARVYEFSIAFEIGASFAYILFGMQLTGIWVNRIWWLRAATIGLVCVLSGMVAYQREWIRPLMDPLSHATGIVFTSAFLMAAIFKRRRTTHLSASQAVVEKFFLIIAGVFIIGQGADWLLRINGIYIRLNQQIDTVMPLFVGSVLLYHLASIQRYYEKEKLARQKIENDIALAREIQDSFAPPPPNTIYGDLSVSCYQIKHSGVAGDWMAIRESKNHGLLLLVADVTGKGVQAALVVHAIQSLWAQALATEDFSPEEWIKDLNRTLLTLGRHRPHSLTLGIVSIRSGSFEYWSFGHPPAYVVVHDGAETTCRVLQARGNLIGIQSELEYRKATLDLNADAHFELAIGTDGIFPKGSRTKPREVLSLVEAVRHQGAQALEQGDQSDDRTMIYVSKGVSSSQGSA